KRLLPLLRKAGHHVVGTTRSSSKGDALRAAGVEAVIVDVFDAPAPLRAGTAARRGIVGHQFSDLPPGLGPRRVGRTGRRHARTRSEGTENRVRAALTSGARRLVVQSIAWIYAPGPQPYSEADPLDVEAQGARAITVAGVVALERLTLSSPPLQGVVLRYG